jgi:hypothetical protein
MSITAQATINKASIVLVDVTKTRWADTELLGWLNDGRREISVIRPDIYYAVDGQVLVAGAKQTLPATAVRLIDVPRNVEGPAITPVERGYLDQQNPAWYQKAKSKTIRHFMSDERSPMTYWVYPPAAVGAEVELVIQEAVIDYSLSSTLSVFEEMYSAALIDYILYRAYSKDAEQVVYAERATAHYNQFAGSLKAGAAVNVSISPNVQNVGGNKKVAG